MFLISLLPWSVHGEQPKAVVDTEITELRKAAVMVEQWEGAYRASANHKGSGTLIAADKVLTANHVIRGCKGPTVIVLYNDIEVGGRVIKQSEKWDVALIHINPLTIIKPVPIHNDVMKIADKPVEVWGHGPNTFWSKQYKIDGIKDGHLWLLGDGHKMTGVNGDSGGGVIDKDGTLLGVLLGANRTFPHTYHVRCAFSHVINAWLRGEEP